MRSEERIELASALMQSFAERTGLPEGPVQRRYLWTDAFAVCNLLGLARATGDPRYGELACALIDRVHETLGKHRDDDARSGWLSGLGETEGARHPTCAGLRIGKPLPERGPDEPVDEQLEWDRDGQYFHYLTRWMHALDLTARTTGDPRFYRWARDLAEAAFAGFVANRAGGDDRMVWKMSIDLSRPLVASMGQHDPIDGLITFAQIRHTGRQLHGSEALAAPISALARMVQQQQLATADPLGLGGLLADAYRLDQLQRNGATVDKRLVVRLLDAAQVGLSLSARRLELRQPAAVRLAFRELGLAIGLAAVDAMGATATGAIGARLDELALFRSLRQVIETFWIDPDNRKAASWREHRDINEVMLATSLLPDGYLTVLPL